MNENIAEIISWLLKRSSSLQAQGEQIGLTPNEMQSLAHRLEVALWPLTKIDLSNVSPLPWKSRAYNVAMGDTGDYMGCCDVDDAEGNYVLAGRGDGDTDLHEVEIGDWTHDANCVAAAACVNAIHELQKQFKELA